MTTLATRTASTPAVIDGEFVETAPPPPPLPPMPAPRQIVAGQRVYVRNPYLIPALGSTAGFFLATAGAAWSVCRDDPRADLAFGLAIGLLFVMATYTSRFNAWDRA
jgi:hypothetical protein